MTSISRLPESIYKRIAAGEVIVSPAAAAKELIENALDAGATAITIETVEGGRDLIRVTDNGCGMSPEDLAMSIEKHATSKITSFEEVYALSSLGFRGEALASIAEVSRLTISTRERGAPAGAELSISGGGEPVVTEAGLPEGTTVRVDDLFYNVPARRKFLKTAAREGAAVSDVVKRLILSRPDVAFKYIRNHHVAYQTSGSGDLRQAAAIVYGPDTMRHMVDVSYQGRHARVQGIVSKPTYVFKNAQRLEFFLNGRYIQSKTLQKAVQQGYQGSILHGHYPACVLNIETDPATVDINIHPAKLAVLLFQEDDIVRDVANAVSKAALENVEPPRLSPAGPQEPFPDQPQRQQNFWTTVPRGMSLAEAAKAAEQGTLRASQPPQAAGPGRSESDTPKACRQPQPASESGKLPEAEQGSRPPQPEPPEEDAYEPEPFADELDRTEPEPEREAEVADVRTLTEYRVIGTAFSTYILCEAGDVIYVIDQHAAQERLTYERLLEAARSGEKYAQQLLLPVVKSFSAADQDLLTEHQALLETLGISFEPFGEMMLRFLSFPVEVAGADTDRFLDSLLEELRMHGTDAVALRDHIITQACRHSVKAGTDLNEKEIARLVHELTTLEAIPHCPHGRPIATALTKGDLEKGFKRRV